MATLGPKTDPRKRIFRASKDSDAALILTDQAAILAGNSNNFIAVDDFGITIKGNISLVTDGTGIRRGGLFLQMPDLLRMIPSTIATPIPPQIPIPPLFGIRNIVRDTAFFSALLI